MRFGITYKIGTLAFILSLVTAVTVGLVFYTGTNSILVRHELEKLEVDIRLKGVRLISSIENLQQDLVFVAGLQPIQGIIRARLAGGLDPKYGFDEEVWREHLANNFTEFLLVHPKYVQARFIGMDDGGREIVRVERAGDIIVRVVGQNLQSKGNRPYFQETIQIKSGEVYLSDITLNREHGRIVEPHLPVIRAAVPVFTPEGEVFGIMIINMNFARVLKSLVAPDTSQARYYVTNDTGDFIAHPDPSMTFGFDTGEQHRIQDIYSELASFFDLSNLDWKFTGRLDIDSQSVALHFHRVPFDTMHPERFLGLAVEASYPEVVAESAFVHKRSIILTLVLSAAMGCLAFFFSHRLTRSLHKIIHAAKAFGSGRDDVSLPVDFKDEIGILAHAFQSMVNKRKHAEERLQFLAHHDSLTNLPNRTLLFDRLSQEIARTRWHKRLMAVLFLDVDRFKVINDTLGHDLGDQLLQTVANRLTDCVRKGDTVSRLGGDEFAILLVDVAEIYDVPEVAKKILRAFDHPLLLDDMEYFITVSIGISLYPNDSEDAQSLVKYADIAMYRAKRQGRNIYQLYSPTMNTKTYELLTLEAKLHGAIEREEFLLHYQPKVDLKKGQIIGMEALVRWQHPDMGIVSPAEFIPLLEETGLIVPVGEWILRTACTQNKALQAAGFPELRVGVNFSALQFKQHNLNEMVGRVLDETGLDPHFLEVELTESILMESTEKTIRLLEELHSMGIFLSIDDFGTGYSSLSYLKRFPIHSLKIDRSFIRDVTTNPDDTAIAKAIIAMAHSLKLKVVAEGVETEEQLTFLIDHQCDEMQGYYFSRPLPFDAFTSLLEEGRHLNSILRVNNR